MIKKRSFFKNPTQDSETMKAWVSDLEKLNGYSYDKRTIETSLGKTQVYGLNSDKEDRETLLVFPGFRTSALIWDLDKGMASLAKELRIFFIETNGQPNLSDGNSPDIKSLDYGTWMGEVFDQLHVQSAYIAGASFGGLVCMKGALVIPDKIKAAFLLNPGCFRTISFGFRNLYYNLLPLIKTSEQTIRRFLDEVIFFRPNHQLSEAGEMMLIRYQLHAIKNYKDNTQKPYYMGDQLNEVKVDTYILAGEKDILLPPELSISNARKHLGPALKDAHVFSNVRHGIECYGPALEYMADRITQPLQR